MQKLQVKDLNEEPFVLAEKTPGKTYAPVTLERGTGFNQHNVEEDLLFEGLKQSQRSMRRTRRLMKFVVVAFLLALSSFALYIAYRRGLVAEIINLAS